MKKNFLKKLFAVMTLGFGVFAMCSCQTTDRSQAIAPLNESSVTILEDKATGSKYATVSIGVSNPTIYNVTGIEVSYKMYNSIGHQIGDEIKDEPVSLYVRHGVAGYASYVIREDSVGPISTVAKVEFTNIQITNFQSLWQTYIAAFICMIIVVAFSIIFTAIELFRKGVTKLELKERMKDKLTSTIVILLLVMLICFIPLIFSSWVATVILIGGFAAALLIDGLMTLIRMAFIKD